MLHKPVVEFRMGAQVLIRRVQLTDLDTIYDSVRSSLPELQVWMPWATPRYSRDDAADWLAQSWLSWRRARAFDFIVEAQSDGRMLGMCGLSEIDVHAGHADLGYWVCSDAVGQGFGTDAARQVVAFAFMELGLARIRLLHAVGNIGSQRIAEKVGFQQEGYIRSCIPLHGQRVDALLYSMVSDLDDGDR